MPVLAQGASHVQRRAEAARRICSGGTRGRPTRRGLSQQRGPVMNCRRRHGGDRSQAAALELTAAPRGRTSDACPPGRPVPGHCSAPGVIGRRLQAKRRGGKQCRSPQRLGHPPRDPGVPQPGGSTARLGRWPGRQPHAVGSRPTANSCRPGLRPLIECRSPSRRTGRTRHARPASWPAHLASTSICGSRVDQPVGPIAIAACSSRLAHNISMHLPRPRPDRRATQAVTLDNYQGQPPRRPSLRRKIDSPPAAQRVMSGRTRCHGDRGRRQPLRLCVATSRRSRRHQAGRDRRWPRGNSRGRSPNSTALVKAMIWRQLLHRC